MKHSINACVHVCHQAQKKAGWWTGVDVNAPFVIPAKLALVHSEISEALEGVRKNQMDDKLPHRKMVEVELAYAVIRIFDLAGAMGLDIGGAIDEKMVFNAARLDHKPENRAKADGKKF
jgi:NTP pyrophosphatase (non-canonical NTP hydrolase)